MYHDSLQVLHDSLEVINAHVDNFKFNLRSVEELRKAAESKQDKLWHEFSEEHKLAIVFLVYRFIRYIITYTDT